jgi:hypothetical protein
MRFFSVNEYAWAMDAPVMPQAGIGVCVVSQNGDGTKLEPLYNDEARTPGTDPVRGRIPGVRGVRDK